MKSYLSLLLLLALVLFSVRESHAARSLSTGAVKALLDTVAGQRYLSKITGKSTAQIGAMSVASRLTELEEVTSGLERLRYQLSAISHQVLISQDPETIAENLLAAMQSNANIAPGQKAGLDLNQEALKKAQEAFDQLVSDAKSNAQVKQSGNQEEDFKAKYLNLVEEFKTQKKLFQQEREKLVKVGEKKIIGDLLEVLDNFDRIIASLEINQSEEFKNIAEGIYMVKKLFLKKLNRHGVTLIESLGKDFDPHVHEAMFVEESELGSNKVIRVFEEGYEWNGQLLRAAKVVVSK